MEKYLKETLPGQFEAVVERVQDRINKEMKFFVGKIEAGLVERGRCLVCTLKVPCKHADRVEKKEKAEDRGKGGKISYWKLTGRELSVPLVDIEKLERIEKFRENRISQDLQRLSLIRESEDKDAEMSRVLEKKRARYMQGQKVKLSGYSEKLKEIRRKIKDQQKQVEELKKKDEEKFKAYIVMQKKKILEKEGQGKCSIGFFKPDA